jgi:hypothetical protein
VPIIVQIKEPVTLMDLVLVIKDSLELIVLNLIMLTKLKHAQVTVMVKELVTKLLDNVNVPKDTLDKLANQLNALINVVIMDNVTIPMDNVLVMKLGKEMIVHKQNNAQITVVIMELAIMDNVIVMKLGKEKIVLKKKKKV